MFSSTAQRFRHGSVGVGLPEGRPSHRHGDLDQSPLEVGDPDLVADERLSRGFVEVEGETGGEPVLEQRRGEAEG